MAEVVEQHKEIMAASLESAQNSLKVRDNWSALSCLTELEFVVLFSFVGVFRYVMLLPCCALFTVL